MMSAKLASLPFVLIGLFVLAQTIEKVLSRRRFGQRGLHATGTVIDHVIREMNKHIVVEFNDRQGRRNTFISEPRDSLHPVSDHVEVVYLPDDPGNAQVAVTAFGFTRSVVANALWSLAFVAAGIVIFVVT